LGVAFKHPCILNIIYSKYKDNYFGVHLAEQVWAAPVSAEMGRYDPRSCHLQMSLPTLMGKAILRRSGEMTWQPPAKFRAPHRISRPLKKPTGSPWRIG
jgi:hypothetical protein